MNYKSNGSAARTCLCCSFRGLILNIQTYIKLNSSHINRQITTLLYYLYILPIHSIKIVGQKLFKKKSTMKTTVKPV